MTALPILKFEPLLKSIVWGGRNLNTVLNRTLPTDEPFGESWEICDLPGNQSVVTSGPYGGVSIETLIERYQYQMLGSASLLEGRFPLLFKFIDAQQTLSVQVHPDSLACRALGQGARPKTEAWYIIDARPDATLYVGLRDGVTRGQFENALEAGTVASLLHEKQVSRGDYVFLPSGTVHAIGAGIVLAEVQQSSNTTYRVFDWNRMGLDGRPRALHMEEALASIHFNQSGEPEVTPPQSGRKGVRCEYFSMETVRLDKGDSVTFQSSGPVAVMCTSGNGVAEIQSMADAVHAMCGETVFIPACQSSHITIGANAPIEMVVTLIP
ncbi:MAG: class I mannose-6-phosphate isomerase [Deltaproteobacteria bacterium]|nr:class I mannose-6-phosphate isomerase [Deltaproteobacteria bacterium]